MLLSDSPQGLSFNYQYTISALSHNKTHCLSWPAGHRHPRLVERYETGLPERWAFGWAPA